MTVSVVTPTCDRPLGISLLENRLALQTHPPDEWIIADGGHEPAVTCRTTPSPFPHRRLHNASIPPGVANFHANLERGIQAATGDLIVIMEDDDWYDRLHLERIVAQLARPSVQIAGDPQQRYYHLPSASWRLMANKGASLCQTGFHRGLIPLLLTVIAARRACLTSASPTHRRRAIGVDYYFWHAVPRGAWALESTRTVVGIKGLPGESGLGIGHRPTSGWTPDPEGTQLRAWVGATDAARYAALGAGV